MMHTEDITDHRYLLPVPFAVYGTASDAMFRNTVYLKCGFFHISISF